jgi:hypothetical protein
MAELDISPNDPDMPKKLQALLGPGQVDQMFRQAIQLCWMALPEDRRTLDELERQIRRMMDRAFKDMREDADQFGLA